MSTAPVCNQQRQVRSNVIVVIIVIVVIVVMVVIVVIVVGLISERQ